MKINGFRGDLTDVLAKTKPLLMNTDELCCWFLFVFKSNHIFMEYFDPITSISCNKNKSISG